MITIIYSTFFFCDVCSLLSLLPPNVCTSFLEWMLSIFIKYIADAWSSSNFAFLKDLSKYLKIDKSTMKVTILLFPFVPSDK